jgi:hypothetical protein
MTIFDYTNLPTISVPYILRDADNIAVTVMVTNQETKESASLPVDDTSVFYDGYFTIDVTELLAGVNENTTFLVSVLDVDSKPIYRDIVVFEQRLDTVSDYEENDETGEYIFVQ